jgi:hypothetical protein
MDETVRVKFGPRDDDSVPLSWAESMLTEMRRSSPNVFGKLLAKVVLNGDK